MTAPVYEREVAAAAEILKATFRKAGAPTKLAWLLEHQYSAAGLSFAGLKGHDAARVQVLRRAVERAGCTAHLGVVHIEETGPAEPHFDMYESDGWRSGWQDDDAPDEEEDLEQEKEADVRDDFDVIEVSDAWHYVDHWVDAQNRSVDFGKLPLKENELLPAGALDDAAPDEQRLTEATGNEGASFERSYRRAALVMWLRDRSADAILLARSEHPAKAPKDWRQEGRIRCTCGDCRQLQTFVLDPVERTHRFRLRKDRRRHLHQQIQRHGLDMAHATEHRGSPQTLVCTKTRRTYERQCAEHNADVRAMSTLLRVIDGARGELATLAARMADATGCELECG